MQSWDTVWWNVGKLTLEHVGIIFLILALSNILSTLLRFSFGNSVGVFLLTRNTRAGLFSKSTRVFCLFYFYRNFSWYHFVEFTNWTIWVFFHTRIIIDRYEDCSQTLEKVHRIASSVMFLGSLQVSGLPTSYLLSQVTLPKLCSSRRSCSKKYAQHAKSHSSHLKRNTF